MREEITNTEQIFNGRIVDLAVHDVKLPNGKQAKRELITHPGAVAIVALDTEQNVLLVRQFRLGADAVLVELPAGTLEAG